MRTPETEQNASVGAAAKEVAEHASGLARLELELAGLELKRKATELGVGAGLGAGAALFAVFTLGFAFATLAAGLATGMSTWLALLITTLILLVIAAVLGLLARQRISKGSPPVPEQAIEEAQKTREALKTDGGT
jgi:uncharacterized membrane protein YqjE